VGDAQPEGSPLGGGRLLAEITNRIVALIREHYGRGPIRAKTYVLDNLITCVLTDGFTAIERTMMEGGQADRVLEIRRDFQALMRERYCAMIEQLTGRGRCLDSARWSSSIHHPASQAANRRDHPGFAYLVSRGCRTSACFPGCVA